MHLDLQNPVAAAGFAPAAFDIEAEASLLIASRLGICRSGEQVPNQVKYPGIRGRIRAGRAPDGRLVDVNDFIQLLDSFDILVLARNGPGPVQFFCQTLVQDFVDQRAFPGAGNACHASHHSQRELHIYILQIVLPGSDHLQPSGRFCPLLGYRYLNSPT